jgi:hypothetical protein
MPLTVVLDQPSGEVQQLQIGAADIVATIAAAHSIWGWVGGLLRLCQRQSDAAQIQDVFNYIAVGQPAYQVLTQNGLQLVSEAEGDEPFGETTASKLIGVTLCALAHNMSGPAAVRFIAKYFVDQLFGTGLAQNPGSKEAVVAFLYDNYRSIINDGIVHGLPERFDAAVDSIKGVHGLKISSDPRFAGELPEHRPEAGFISGFLIWLFKVDAGQAYYTRSGAVARIAVCLRSAGYKVGDIIVWNGSDRRPSPSRGLVLVVGGTSETDEYMYHINSENITAVLISHFQWKTVGALFWNAFDQVFSHSPHESFQQVFDDIDDRISEALPSFQWSVIDENSLDVQAFPVWSSEPGSSSRIAVSLATVFFRDSIEYLAPYYETIATEEHLRQVKSRPWGLADAGNITMDSQNLSRELQQFLVVTASVCISVLGRIGGDNFSSIRHSALTNFFTARHFRKLCHEVDAILKGGCGMGRVIRAVAAVHCGQDLTPDAKMHEEGEQVYSSSAIDGSLIGWRNGRYAILPNLLFRLSSPLDPSVLDIHCTDQFIANIPVQQDGAIRSQFGGPGAIMFVSHDLSPWQDTEPSHDLERATPGSEINAPITLGPPSSAPPDKPLYLSLERPPIATETLELTLCGRVDGISVGNVIIPEILRTLALSWCDDQGYYAKSCEPGTIHRTPDSVPCKPALASTVYNMPVSRYCEWIDTVPRANEEKQNGTQCVLVQVAEDPSWTIFLAGQSQWHNRVVFGCPQCAIEAGGNCADNHTPLRTLIGYNLGT